MEIIIAILIALAGGAAVAYVLSQTAFRKKMQACDAEVANRREQLEDEIKKKLEEAQRRAEVIKKERMVEAKEKFQQLKLEHEKQSAERTQKLSGAENRIKQMEDAARKLKDEAQRQLEEVAKRESDLAKKSTRLDEQLERRQEEQEKLKAKQQELERIRLEQVDQLEKVAGLTREEAMAKLVANLKVEADSAAKAYVKDAMDEAKTSAVREAKKIVLATVQRSATEQAIENCISVFNLDNDDIKGRIIGREGRNIRALEQATGIEIIIDDTPEAIVLSGFDPVRREIARLALHKLVSDGRIHPARIEEVVEKTRKQIEEEMMEIGERTVMNLGIHGLHNDLIRLVGKMRYRSSYGQNLLQHSREVANFCAIMASELGLNAKLAKRAGLLHDIGKVSEEDPELPHALLGMKIAERYKENPIVLNAIGAHHDEIEMTDSISPIVQVCDAISGARPGARREIFEQYTKRLKDLENIALTYPGVTKSYALQAGRELRVIVESDKVGDEAVDTLAFDISNQIQTEMTYPGQIKITVIREKRAVSFAK